MKNLSLCLLLLVLLPFSNMAQPSSHKRVKIWTTDSGMIKLSRLGIETDHGDYRKNVWFISDFSTAEIEKIKQAGFKYEVLIDDVGAYYQAQSPGVNSNRLSAAGSCNSSAPFYTTPSNFNLGSMGGYFTYQEMLDNLDSMASKFPNLITIKQALPGGTTVEGQPVFYVKISDNANVDETENEILYTAVHHAREPGGMSQLIFYMWYLLENYVTNQQIASIVDNTELYFVPCLNPDGYQFNELNSPTGGGMWRKNRKDNLDGTFGVDLNRNYGYNWGYDDDGSSPFGGDETFRGSGPFSEPETQLMRDFVEAHEFSLALNYHTFGNLLIYPWGYDYSTYTPDSALLTNYGNLLTTYNGYTFGTADQTVGYIVNGSSDDWMYGEQLTKPKVLAMTPECGDAAFGFWPPSTEIIPLCENTMFQNITFAQLAGRYATLKETSPQLISNAGGYITFDLTQLGLDTTGTYTISLSPLSANIFITGNAVSHSNLSVLQTVSDSISFGLTSPMTNGDEIRFLLSIDNGQYFIHDTIVKYFGTPSVAFASDGNSTGGFNAGGWGVSTTEYYSPSGSITDSPVGPYASNATSSVRLSSAVDLTTAVQANLSFYCKWELEPNYDFVQVQASTNNGASWTALCGNYTVPGSSFQAFDEPVYEGFQTSWVKEEISLNDYIGTNILIRFRIQSDGFLEYDGYYFDDLLISKVLPGTNGIVQQPSQQNGVLVTPNPASLYTYINFDASSEKRTITITDASGRVVMENHVAPQQTSERIDLSEMNKGIYFITVQSSSAKEKPVKLVIQ